MTPSSSSARIATRWNRLFAVSLLGWMLAWLLVSTQAYIYARGKGLPTPWLRLVGSFSDFVLVAACTPFILRFVWRFPLSRHNWRRALPLHVLVGLVYASVVIVPMQTARYGLSLFLGDQDLFASLTPNLFARWVVSQLFMYIDIVLLGHAMHYSRESRSKDLKTSRLQAQLAQAQLDVLRMQLHPHFLFNTLHSISALMHKDVGAADRMITRLGDLLRMSLDRVSAQLVPLRQELEFLQGYLDIEQIRFHDRLTVKLDVAPDVLDAQVPNLLLQPLVENSLRHGIERRSGSGYIELRARREDERVVIRLRDNGPGITGTPELAMRGGVGLANTEARLKQLYEGNHRFELRNREGGGLEVMLVLPLRCDHAPSIAASDVPVKPTLGDNASAEGVKDVPLPLGASTQG